MKPEETLDWLDSHTTGLFMPLEIKIACSQALEFKRDILKIINTECDYSCRLCEHHVTYGSQCQDEVTMDNIREYLKKKGIE